MSDGSSTENVRVCRERWGDPENILHGQLAIHSGASRSELAAEIRKLERMLWIELELRRGRCPEIEQKER